jgi:hypothetical protein
MFRKLWPDKLNFDASNFRHLETLIFRKCEKLVSERVVKLILVFHVSVPSFEVRVNIEQLDDFWILEADWDCIKRDLEVPFTTMDGFIQDLSEVARIIKSQVTEVRLPKDKTGKTFQYGQLVFEDRNAYEHWMQPESFIDAHDELLPLFQGPPDTSLHVDRNVIYELFLFGTPGKRLVEWMTANQLATGTPSNGGLLIDFTTEAYRENSYYAQVISSRLRKKGFAAVAIPDMYL